VGFPTKPAYQAVFIGFFRFRSVFRPDRTEIIALSGWSDSPVRRSNEKK